MPLNSTENPSLKHPVEIFTDGACRGNPGPGGWGAILLYADKQKEIYGGEPMTTNNRMELTAAIRALETLKRPCRVRISTDSTYVMKGITEWLEGGIRRGWKTQGNQPVKNIDLWQALVNAQAPHQVDWRWVKGHSGHPQNDRADALANLGIDALIKKQE